jgi:hypothetical protein
MVSKKKGCFLVFIQRKACSHDGIDEKDYNGSNARLGAKGLD